MVGKWSLSLWVLFLASCASSQTYTANSPKVLVQPTQRAWLKPGSTMEDERAAKRECSEELRSNDELRRESEKFDEEVRQGLRKRPTKDSRDPWSAAGHSCMQRKGFQHYEGR